jgi:hypothetical protein
MIPIIPPNQKKPVVYFTEKAYTKMWALVDLNPKEIGWHGTVNRKDNIFIITDILVYPQTVTATSIVADAKEFNKWLEKYMLDPKDNTFDKMRMHGHSHVNMGTTPSTTDRKLQEDHLKQLKGDDFYIFLIVNKKREIWATIYDLKTNIQYETADIEIMLPNSNAVKWAKKESKEKLQKPKPTPQQALWGKPIRKTPYAIDDWDDILENEMYSGYPEGDERNHYFNRRNK